MNRSNWVLLAFLAYRVSERYRDDAPAGPADSTAAPSGESNAENEDAPAPSLPSFDIVRIDRSGDAVIAGRAAPEAEVTVYANGTELKTARAESDGSWVMTADAPLDAGAVELTLSMKTKDGVVVVSDRQFSFTCRKGPATGRSCCAQRPAARRKCFRMRARKAWGSARSRSTP